MTNVPQPRTRLWVRLALILSLGLNLLILGAVLGFVLVGGAGRSRRADARAARRGPWVRSCRFCRRRIARNWGTRLRENRGRFGESSGRPLGQAVRGFAEALRAEPFDRVAAEAALERTARSRAGPAGGRAYAAS